MGIVTIQAHHGAGSAFASVSVRLRDLDNSIDVKRFLERIFRPCFQHGQCGLRIVVFQSRCDFQPHVKVSAVEMKSDRGVLNEDALVVENNDKGVETTTRSGIVNFDCGQRHEVAILFDRQRAQVEEAFGVGRLVNVGDGAFVVSAEDIELSIGQRLGAKVHLKAFAEGITQLFAILNHVGVTSSVEYIKNQLISQTLEDIISLI
jgi:hypothetical protein